MNQVLPFPWVFLVVAGVAVGEVLEGEVERGVEGAVEGGRPGGIGHHGAVGRVLVDDVVPGPHPLM